MVLIGILGEKRSGKDTVSDYMVDDKAYHKLTFAKPLKDMGKVLFGFNDRQSYGDLKEVVDPFWQVTPRFVWQWLGTNILRDYVKENNILPNTTNDFFVRICEKKYLEIRDSVDDIVISDVRCQNEVDFIHKYNGVVIKLIRPNMRLNDPHKSEKEITSITDYDHLVINDGTIDQLYKKIDKLCD